MIAEPPAFPSFRAPFPTALRSSCLLVKQPTCHAGKNIATLTKNQHYAFLFNALRYFFAIRLDFSCQRCAAKRRISHRRPGRFRTRRRQRRAQAEDPRASPPPHRNFIHAVGVKTRQLACSCAMHFRNGGRRRTSRPVSALRATLFTAKRHSLRRKSAYASRRPFRSTRRQRHAPH